MSASSLVMPKAKPGRKVPSLPLQEPRSPQKKPEEKPKEVEPPPRPKKPSRPKITPAGRDRLAQFASRRNDVKEAHDRVYTVIVKRLAQLSMDYLSKPAAQGMLSFLWGGEQSLHIPVVGVDLNLPTLDESAKTCNSCGTAFGYFQKKVLCQLCMKYHCSKCCIPRIPLQVINETPKAITTNAAAPPQVPMINACERCSKIVKNWKYSQKFQRTRLSCATNPLVIKYNNLLKRDEIAVEAMVNYEGCVNQADPQKPTRRAPEDPDNILAMRLGEASHYASQVEKHLQTMAAAIQDIKTTTAPPDPSKPAPTTEANRKLVNSIHATATTRLEGNISYYQTLQKRLIRLQLIIVGDVYNKFQQLILEVNQMHHPGGADHNGEKTGEKNGDGGPNIYLLLREVLAVIKAEIQEMMVTLGKRQWEKFERTLNATLKNQMAHGQKLLNVPFSKEGDEMQSLMMMKLISVIQHEALVLENNTAIPTLRESKRMIKSATNTLVSYYV